LLTRDVGRRPPPNIPFFFHLQILISRTTLFAWLLAITLIAFPWTPVGQAQTGCAQFQPGEYAAGLLLVGHSSKASLLTPTPIIEQLTLSTLPALGVRMLRVPPGQECAWLDRLRAQPSVAFVEPDFPMHAADVLIPNDPDWNRQWSLERIQMPPAWGLAATQTQILIGIVDSGVQLNHPDLASQVWTNLDEVPGNQLDDDQNGMIDDVHGWHFYHVWTPQGYIPAENANVWDDYGHGTHISGIAAAATHNATGIASVSWDAQALPVKVLDQYGNGWYSDIAAGIVYAVDNGAKVINLSLGGAPASATLRLAIDYAIDHGSLVVASAGNEGGAVWYPAAYSPVLAVAATDASDQRASFSNYGPEIDLAAPGSGIYSTWNFGNYLSKSGTSMAAPHVSGLVAFLWSSWPTLSASEVITTLMRTADDITEPGYDPFTGWGRINAYRSAAWLAGRPDLWAALVAPLTVQPGEIFTYTISIGNQGSAGAINVWITDTLPAGVEALEPASWNIDLLNPSTSPMTLTLPVIARQPGVWLDNHVSIQTTSEDPHLRNNQASALTQVLYTSALPMVIR
jgi:uncharacterized repeat protein (TIGR01451 family)